MCNRYWDMRIVGKYLIFIKFQSITPFFFHLLMLFWQVISFTDRGKKVLLQIIWWSIINCFSQNSNILWSIRNLCVRHSDISTFGYECHMFYTHRIHSILFFIRTFWKYGTDVIHLHRQNTIDCKSIWSALLFRTKKKSNNGYQHKQKRIGRSSECALCLCFSITDPIIKQ